MTNAYRRGHSPSNQIMDSKGYMYENIITPLVSDKKVGTGINKSVNLPHMMNDNKIDCIDEVPTKLWIVCDCSRPDAKWIMVMTTRFCRLSKSKASLIIN